VFRGHSTNEGNHARCGLIGYGAWDPTTPASSPPIRAPCWSRLRRGRITTRERARLITPPVASFADYRDLLAQEALDAVVVVLPSHLHFEVSRAVLESGRHLLMEKPMCLTVEHLPGVDLPCPGEEASAGRRA